MSTEPHTALRRRDIARVYRAMAARIQHMASVDVARQWLLTTAANFEAAADEAAREPRALIRLRLPLDRHNSDLLLVGDGFDEGGRYVQQEVPRGESEVWTWLEWDDVYDRMADEWRRRFVPPGGASS